MKASPKNNVHYSLDSNGCFVIDDYNQSKPFSNFFPGIAGIWGIPMWVFFVNRGQCIASFGIEGKDKSIMEFQPANKAYRLTSLHGFRTFIKVKTGARTLFWEPFQDHSCSASFKTRQKMSMTSHDLTIEEVNTTLGLAVRVNYFTVAKEEFPALVRRVTIENISRKKCEIELVDGLPVIMPYGTREWLAKSLSRTVEAWFKVSNLKSRAPFFHLNVEVSDTPDVQYLTEGNFYLSFDTRGQKTKLLDVIVDASCVFGRATDFVNPQSFLKAENYSVPSLQQTSNRTPCAMSFTKFGLPAKHIREIVSVIGYAHSDRQLKKIVTKVTARGFIEKKAAQNNDLVNTVKNYAVTNSSSAEFNLYSSQNFLDNVLRGGLPVSLKTGEGNVTFNVFSRKHGDLERDYNYFTLSPTYFSQGNGNYRDVNQNRRNDVWFNKDVRDSSIINFLSLSQADGYNPLVVKGVSFYVEDPERIDEIMKKCVNGDVLAIRERLQEGFQPGELLHVISKNHVSLKCSEQEFLTGVLGACCKQEVAEHGEGFWSDHWTYNLDLIESFLSKYPEELPALLLGKKAFGFYHNTHYVLPRSERYLLTEKGVRQYRSVIDGYKEIKANENGNRLRTQNGTGEVYTTTLMAKLLCLITNKAATFDPSGIGIEMEGGRPNWYDALNGLPGLLGSSLNETLELRRYCLFVLDAIKTLGIENRTVAVFKELAVFIEGLKEILSNEGDPTAYWHQSNDVKEQYRRHVLKGIDGKEQDLSVAGIKDFLRLIVEKTGRAIEHAKDKNGLIATYFYHEVTDYAKLDMKHGEYPYVLPVTFKKHALPLFLEGFVHLMRVQGDREKARKLFKKLKKSDLFDKKLGMYKVTSDLSSETEEIGRARIFPRGWLENESIWLHMEYKYLLELLRSELYEEFYEAFEDALIPFLNPRQYGRSTLENSSFLVSSVHEDKASHGQGFVARLSGSTAEFVHIWLFMNTGQRPFVLDKKGKMFLELKPALPGWLFTKKATKINYLDKEEKWQVVPLPKNTYAFNFLGSTLTVYHNPKRMNTFGPKGCQVKEILLTYPGRQQPIKITQQIIPSPHAQDIRENKVDRIDVYFQ